MKYLVIGCGLSGSVIARELAEAIRTELGVETRLNFGKRLRSESEIMFSTARNRSLITGLVPQVTFKEGIGRAVRCFKEVEKTQRGIVRN